MKLIHKQVYFHKTKKIYTHFYKHLKSCVYLKQIIIFCNGIEKVQRLHDNANKIHPVSTYLVDLYQYLSSNLLRYNNVSKSRISEPIVVSFFSFGRVNQYEYILTFNFIKLKLDV